MYKRKQIPTTECQYGINCYRKNPNHFEQFSHNHIQKVVQGGKTNGEYSLPNELKLSEDVVRVQCDIVEKLFSHLMSPPSKKFAKAPDAEESDEITTIDDSPVKQVPVADPPIKQPEKVTSPPLNPDATEFKPQASTSAVTPTTPKYDESKDTEEQRQAKREICRNVHDYFDVVPQKGEMAQKLARAAPYNFFLTTITDSKQTHTESLSVSFMELLDESLGDLESSVQINFMVDVSWLMANYYFAGQSDKPLLILYGQETDDLLTITSKRPNVTAIKVNMGGNPFSIHHSKISILCYKDGSSRIIISTANLYIDDWHNRTQGLWISDKLLPMDEDADTTSGESATGFRNDFITYLSTYKITKLQPYITRLRKSDFSCVNVFFIGSVPGAHREVPNRGHPYGHPRVGYLLGKHAAPIDDSSAIVAQSSSVGSLGPSLSAFIGSEFSNSFRKDSAPLGIRRTPQFKFIYPSYNNVKNSYDDLLGGGCLPYRRAGNEKQPWLKQHMYQWKAKCRYRNQAMPHIKTYARWTDRGLYWFLLTSANLSKGAWGSFNKTAKIEPPLRIGNYEAGVLFLPKFVINSEKPMNYFPLEHDKNDVPKFPMPYDIPLTPYSPEDVPFVMEHLEYFLQNQQQKKK